MARAYFAAPRWTHILRIRANAQTHVFVRSSAFSSQLPAAAEWIEIEPFFGQEAPGFAGGDSGASQLEMLRAAADVKSLGVERVHGVSLHRYQTTIDLGHLADLVETEGNDRSPPSTASSTKPRPNRSRPKPGSPLRVSSARGGR